MCSSDLAIYGFRGASPLILQQFPEDFPGCRVLTLKWNYRSTQNIIAFSGNLIRYNRNRYEKKMAPGKKVAGMEVRQEIFSQQEQEATAIAEYFQNLHRRGMDYDQMAVLLRTSYPVSYTHLDVYKRQELFSLCWMKSKGRIWTGC